MAGYEPTEECQVGFLTRRASVVGRLTPAQPPLPIAMVKLAVSDYTK